MNNKKPVHIYPRLAARFRRLVRCRGQTLVEYALILSIISIVLVGVVVNLGTQVKTIFSTVNSQISSAPGAAASH